MENAFGLAIAGEVGELRRFVVHLIEHQLHFPMLVDLVLAGIEIDARFFAGETIDQHIGIAIVVEVVDEGEEVVGVIVVGFVGAGFLVAGGFVDLVLLGEVRAFIPPRAGDDVHFAVFVEVGEVGAFAIELVVERNSFFQVSSPCRPSLGATVK
jgi:hypothetical protein